MSALTPPLFAITFLMVAALFGLLCNPGFGQDPDTLARQADKQLRTAERSLFSGKIEEAAKLFAEAQQTLEKLRAADPNHRNLRSLESKEKKLTRDLARRMPKDVDPKTTTVPKPDDPKEAKLPGGVTKRLQDFDRAMKRLDDYMAQDSPASPDSRVKSARGYLDKAKDILGEIEKRYGDEIPADSPEMDTAKQRLADAETSVAGFGKKLEAAAAAKAAEPGPGGATVDADREIVEKLYEKYYDELSMIHGRSLVYGSQPSNVESAVEQLAKADAEMLPELQKALGPLADRYGTGSTEIDHALGKLGVPPNQRFSTKLGTLIEGMGNVDKSRAASAEQVARDAKMNMENLSAIATEYRPRSMEKIKACLLGGQKIDPNNAEINALVAKIDDLMAETAETLEAEIDARTWAGHIDDFPGPGDVEELAAAALEWFRKDDRWGANPNRKIEILKVAVRGPWKVADRDIFGRLIRWRLPIHLAISDEKMGPKDIARVYELSILALEGPAEKAPRKPPYDGYWVGESWMMRKSKL
jgi:hypothetical protein